jgi:hypothetical protein
VRGSVWNYAGKNPIAERLQLIGGYQKWVRGYVDRGWDPYFVSLMFHQLPGSQASVLRQMKGEIERVYSRLVTRFDRNPRSPAGSQRLPVMILFPDLPVYKREKRSIKDVSINDGLHYGGIALTPPVSRFRGTLDGHFEEEQDNYVSDKLERIYVKPISSNIARVVDYAAKTFKRGRVSDADIIILPKTTRELPSK